MKISETIPVHVGRNIAQLDLDIVAATTAGDIPYFIVV